MLVTDAKETQKVRVLDRVPYICYPMQFWKNMGKNVLVLLNSKSEVNVMTLVYTTQLGLKVQKTNIVIQKIDKSLLKTYSIVIAAFQILNKLRRFWFFQKTFLLTDISVKVVFGIPFLTFSNADI